MTRVSPVVAGLENRWEPGNMRALGPGTEGDADWLLWQLADSAFPTGGFAHSGGLESAWQHGEIAGRDELLSCVETALHQLGHAALPFVTAAHEAPARLSELDRLCDAFTANHVANRASRAQGRALLLATGRIFGANASASEPPCAHLAPVFGAVTRGLGISRRVASRLLFFLHLRNLLAAAVKLNIIGPMDAQALQSRLGPKMDEILRESESLTIDDIAQTSPLLEAWQGAHDRLYSRLFQS